MMDKGKWIDGSHGELETIENCYMPRFTQHTVTKWSCDGFMYTPDMDGVDTTYHIEVIRDGKHVHKGDYLMHIKGSEGRHMIRLLHTFYACSDMSEHPLSHGQMQYYTGLAVGALNSMSHAAAGDNETVS